MVNTKKKNKTQTLKCACLSARHLSGSGQTQDKMFQLQHSLIPLCEQSRKYITEVPECIECLTMEALFLPSPKGSYRQCHSSTFHTKSSLSFSLKKRCVAKKLNFCAASSFLSCKLFPVLCESGQEFHASHVFNFFVFPVCPFLVLCNHFFTV